MALTFKLIETQLRRRSRQKGQIMSDDILSKAMPHTHKVIFGTAEMGMAKGLEIGANVMIALANDAARGKVDASEIRAAAASLRASAERKRVAAEDALKQYETQT